MGKFFNFYIPLVGLISVHNGLNRHHGHLANLSVQLLFMHRPISCLLCQAVPICDHEMPRSIKIIISCFVNVITLFIHNYLMILCLWIVPHPHCLACAFIMHHIPITWWLPGSPSRGCYLTSQIFARKSEAGIGIRASKGVDWHCFHVTCIKFEVGTIF